MSTRLWQAQQWQAEVGAFDAQGAWQTCCSGLLTTSARSPSAARSST